LIIVLTSENVLATLCDGAMASTSALPCTAFNRLQNHNSLSTVAVASVHASLVDYSVKQPAAELALKVWLLLQPDASLISFFCHLLVWELQ
jgi:hypothetical protein